MGMPRRQISKIVSYEKGTLPQYQQTSQGWHQQAEEQVHHRPQSLHEDEGEEGWVQAEVNNVCDECEKVLALLAH